MAVLRRDMRHEAGYCRVEKKNIKTCKTIVNSYFKSFEQFFFENVQSKKRKLKTNKTIK